MSSHERTVKIEASVDSELLEAKNSSIMINRYSKEKVLVTGGSGMVGKAIQEELERNPNHKEKFYFIFLASKDADLRDPRQSDHIFNEHKPDYVINLAARVGGLYANMSDNESFFSINNEINGNVLRCSLEHQVKKCISCLSTCIFPDEIEYPLDETKIHLGPPHSSNYGYSLAKRQVDLLNKRYNELCEGPLFTAIIPTNIFGRHDNYDLEQSHVIPGLIHRAYLSAVEAKSSSNRDCTIVVYGSGKPLRQFIYAPDLAKLILWTLNSYSSGDAIILSPDETEELSIEQIADIICDVFGEKFNLSMGISFDTSHSDGQFKKTASNRKLRLLNPEFEFTPMNVAIREVIDWFCLVYPEVRR